jgi:hypothetical protein
MSKFEKPVTYDTISVLNGFCIDCGWPVIHACCNGDFTLFNDSDSYDYWYYCSNKSCKNHTGTGVFQDDPEWFKHK